MTQQDQPESANSLPLPDTDAAAHSEKLKQCINEKIAQEDGISFTEYMQTVLYEPGLGYYSAGSTKLGEQGDFVTAPEISPFFSKSIAQAILPVLESIEVCNILEVGAGSGQMATDILLQLEALNKLPQTYYILELSADLRMRQQQLIKQKAPDLFECVTWLDQIPDNLNAVVLANELLDAMPVVRFRKEIKTISIEYVIEENNNYQAEFKQDETLPFYQRTKQRVDKIEEEVGALETGFISEVNFNAEDWISSISDKLNSGIIILIDYGYPQHEYYHAQRNEGTLNCFYRHRHHNDPFIYPGLQDLTAHIDFTAIADSGVSNDLNLIGYTTQSSFLFGAGIAQLVEQNASDDVVTQIETANQIKKLTMPYEMGEVVKVIGFSKSCDVSLNAFYFKDMRDHL